MVLTPETQAILCFLFAMFLYTDSRRQQDIDKAFLCQLARLVSPALAACSCNRLVCASSFAAHTYIYDRSHCMYVCTNRNGEDPRIIAVLAVLFF